MTATAAAFPLCRDPRHDGVLRRVVEGCGRFLAERLPGRVMALVLTGSFSRGEGTVLAVAGRLRVLGDIEFLVVLPTRNDYRSVRRQAAALGREASAVLGGGEVAVDIEFGPVAVRYFQHRARPSIFVYDLATHGKVVWGAGDVLRAIPRFGRDAIPRTDAVHLVFNRTIEQLEAYDRVGALAGEALLDLAYQRVKLTLDLAGSALAFAGLHATSYADRPDAFARLLARTPALAARLPASFEAELARAARTKLAPDEAPLLPDVPLDAQQAWLRARIAGAGAAVAAVLTWELEQLFDSRAPLSRLLDRWIASQPPGRRVRDWAKLALNPLPAPVPISRRRALALARRSTPRALLYAAGTSAYLDLDGRHTLGDVAALLPLDPASAPRTPADTRRTITALWRWCVRNS